MGLIVKTPEDLAAEKHTRKCAQVNAERQRRLDAGSAFEVPGFDTPIPLTGRAMDQPIYLALLLRAQSAKAAGITAPVLMLRDGNDDNLALTPDQMIALITQAMDWFEAVMAVSWAMKDGSGPFEAGIPDNLTDDQWWP